MFKKDKSTILSISNQKGGEGKTTISLGLAEAFSKSTPTLLVDWDPQANSTRLFYPDIETSSWAAIPYKGKQTVSVESILHPLKDNLTLLPSGLDLANFTTAFERDDFDRLKDLLDPLRKKFPMIVIDCPPALGLLLENALIASDSVLIPIQTRAFSVQGIADLNETISKLQKKANPDLKLLGAVLNQFEDKKALSGLKETIRKNFPVFETYIPKKESIPQSQAKRKFLGDYDKETFSVFLELAKEIGEKSNV